MIRILVALLSLLSHFVKADTNAGLCTAVDGAQSAIADLQRLMNSSVITEELTPIKDRTAKAIGDIAKTQRSVYSLLADAINRGSPISREDKTCLQTLTKPTFVVDDMDNGAVAGNQAYEAMEEQCSDEFATLTRLENERSALTENPSTATLSSIREACDQSPPRNVAYWIHNQTVTTSYIPTVLQQALQGNLKAWRSWALEILADFIFGISLDQICVAVKGGERLSVEDMQRPAGQQTEYQVLPAKFQEVFDKLIQIERQVKG